MEFKVDDLDIVEATYFLLKSNPDFYRKKWKWSAFIKKYFQSENPKIKWQVYSLNRVLTNLTNKL